MLFVVLLGGPGAGKGTQARLLQKTLEIPQVSSGELFRENIEQATKLGQLAKSFIDAGELVPDDVTVNMVRARLSAADCSNGALLDGFPRTVVQAEALKQYLGERKTEVTIVPCVSASNEVLLERLAGRWTCRECGHVFHIIFDPPKEASKCDFDGSVLYQREDDTEETQRRRIEIYFERTAPLLKYYDQQGLLVEIDGEQSIEAVQKDLVAAIRLRQGLNDPSRNGV
jgi:adenylate kinase